MIGFWAAAGLAAGGIGGGEIFSGATVAAGNCPTANAWYFSFSSATIFSVSWREMNPGITGFIAISGFFSGASVAGAGVARAGVAGGAGVGCWIFGAGCMGSALSGRAGADVFGNIATGGSSVGADRIGFISPAGVVSRASGLVSCVAPIGGAGFCTTTSSFWSSSSFTSMSWVFFNASRKGKKTA